MNPGEIIKNRRLELGMTQEELGEKIGVQKSAVAKYESGKVENLKRSVIEKLSEVLNLSPTQIMGFEEDEDILQEFTTFDEAVENFLKQNVVMGFNGFDVTKLSEEQKVEYANELKNMLKLLSYKFKDKWWNG